MSGSAENSGLNLNENKGPNILAPMWALTMITTSLVCARIFIRAKVVKKVGFDDWVIVVSMVRMFATTFHNLVALYNHVLT